DGVGPLGLRGWLTMLAVTALGILAVLPFGLIVGSLIPGSQKGGTWGMLPIMVLFGISGIFFPISNLWGWVQALAQVFPMYWLGLGMRSAFLPDAAAALEIGGSWRTLETVLVLATWAVVGLTLAPSVLPRMAERKSGSPVQEARVRALQQWVRCATSSTTGSPCCGQSAASPDGSWPKRWGSTTRRSDIWSVGSTPPASTSPSRSPSTSTCPSRWCSRCGPSPAWEARPSRADLLVELVDEGVDEPPVVVEAVVP